MSQSEGQNNLEQVNPSISQSRLASLVGFEEEVTQEQEQTVSASSDPSQEPKDVTTSSSDLEPSAALDPRDASSFRPVWARPGNKAYVVMAGTSVVAVLLYGISNTLFNTPLRQAQKPPTSLQEFPAPEETKNPIGTLKVETALGDQAAAIAKLNEKNQLSKHNKATPVRPGSQKVPSATQPAPQRVATPVARPPAPRYVREPSRRSNYPLVRQYPRAISPTPPTPAIAQRPSAPPQVPETKDPMEQWLAASQMGSYSSSSNREDRPQQENQDEQITSDLLPSPETPVEYASLTSSNSRRPSIDEQTSSDDYQAQEYPILQESPRQFIRAGTTARATLATSLAWDDSEKSLEDDGSVVIVLDEPIVAADGAVIVPEGSQLIAKVQSLYDSGLVRLVAVAAIKERDGERVEINIPSSAIIVRGIEGQPLIAKQLKSERSGGFGSDVSRVLIGAARNGASILNRPRQSSSFSSGGYSSSSQTNDPDFLAGAFEGASETLLDNLEQRNQRSSRQTSRRSSVWVLKAKTKVEVFVSKSVPLDVPNKEPHQLLEDQEQINPIQPQSQLRDADGNGMLFVPVPQTRGDHRAKPFNLESTNSSFYYLSPQQDFDLPNR